MFYYGGDGSQGTSSGGDGASCCTYCYGCEFANCNGATTLEEVASQGCCPENFVLRYSIQSYGEDRSKYDCVAFIEEANCDGTWVTDSCARGGEDATGAAMSYSYSYSYGGSSASRRRRRLAGSYSYSYSAETATGADQTVEFAEQTFGLCAGNVEGQLEIVGGRQIVDLGRRIDWREFHHFLSLIHI